MQYKKVLVFGWSLVLLMGTIDLYSAVVGTSEAQKEQYREEARFARALHAMPQIKITQKMFDMLGEYIKCSSSNDLILGYLGMKRATSKDAQEIGAELSKYMQCPYANALILDYVGMKMKASHFGIWGDFLRAFRSYIPVGDLRKTIFQYLDWNQRCYKGKHLLMIPTDIQWDDVGESDTRICTHIFSAPLEISVLCWDRILAHGSINDSYTFEAWSFNDTSQLRDPYDLRATQRFECSPEACFKKLIEILKCKPNIRGAGSEWCAFLPLASSQTKTFLAVDRRIGLFGFADMLHDLYQQIETETRQGELEEGSLRAAFKRAYETSRVPSFIMQHVGGVASGDRILTLTQDEEPA